MRKTFQYRLFPTKLQVRRMNLCLRECRWLYNQLLEQRKTAWEERQESLGLYDQHKSIPTLVVQRPSLKIVHAQVRQTVALRIDLAIKAFFRRCKAGENPGYPRFRGANRYDSFTFPQVPSGCQVIGSAVRLSKIGDVGIMLHRPLEGVTKTCTIKRSSTGKWYASFSCEVPDPLPLPTSPEQIGIDVGLTTFATFSNGETVGNPRFLRTEESALAQVQRRFSKTEKGTPERRKVRQPVARVYERIRFRRTNFAHQESRCIVNRFGTIAVEDLAVNQMVHNHCLAKSIMDAAWSQFRSLLAYKAAWAGRQYVEVNPAYTSQNCSRCGHRKRMPLEQRIYICDCCGLSLGRDHNAALNILGLGLQALA